MTNGKEDLKLKYKIWLEKQTKNIMGKGGAALLEQIKIHKNLGKAAKELGYSYKYAWNILKKIKNKTGEEPVITYKGGTGGGGGIELTDFGEKLLIIYNTFNDYVEDAIKNRLLWQSYGFKQHETNSLIGKVLEIKKDNEVAILKIRIPKGQKINSLITRESTNALKLEKGKNVSAVIKSTSVMVLKEGFFDV
ncbi:MAG: molybdenum-dependent transcriptional regulator [Candidatus Lokiarchaeota archaeon]|nr:molybdenum-dependent transcriptional regulator [Candidatus Lokiarchaeota archaeon]